jgi:phage head maturation protease
MAQIKYKMKKKIELDIQHRNLDIRSGKINEEDRTVEVSFSSEEPVERYFGIEILDHKPESVDLSRLNNSAAVLEDHQGGQIGVVVGAKIENGRGLAKLKFSKVGRGAEVWEDIKDGIRSNISFGYQLNDLTRSKDEDNGETPAYRSKSWMPYEISVVGTPADTTIGIGRSKEANKTEIEVEDSFRDLSEPKKEVEEDKKVNIETCKIQEKYLTLIKLKENK